MSKQFCVRETAKAGGEQRVGAIEELIRQQSEAPRMKSGEELLMRGGVRKQHGEGGGKKDDYGRIIRRPKGQILCTRICSETGAMIIKRSGQ